DQHESRWINTLRHQRIGNRTGARAELDDRSWHIRIDVGRHLARQHAARRRHRADRQRLLDPGAEEAELVIDADAFPLLESPDGQVELLLLGVEALAETLAVGIEALFDALAVRGDLAFELAPKRAVLQLEQTDLPLNLPFENLQGLKGHRWG